MGPLDVWFQDTVRWIARGRREVSSKAGSGFTGAAIPSLFPVQQRAAGNTV